MEKARTWVELLGDMGLSLLYIYSCVSIQYTQTHPVTEREREGGENLVKNRQLEEGRNGSQRKKRSCSSLHVLCIYM